MQGGPERWVPLGEWRGQVNGPARQKTRRADPTGTFAIGGSLTGYLGKRIMPLFGIEAPWIYIPVYILLVTLIWPMMVLLISIPFGQFKFFTGYLKKMGQRMGLKS